MLPCRRIVFVYVVYRPPPSRTNKLKNSTFFDEWTEFIDRLAVIQEELIVTGDLNFHLDNEEACDTRKFLETLRDHGLVQHIRGPTHNRGHTLDVVITRENSLILQKYHPSKIRSCAIGKEIHRVIIWHCSQH